MLFLAGDIGGTKALLQLIYTSPEQAVGLSTSANRSNPGNTTPNSLQFAKQSYPCVNFDSLESIINTFLSQALSADNLSSFADTDIDADFLKIQSACFGLPGPVNGRKVQLTNLPWVVDAQKIEQACAIQSVHFVNDFYAAAKGVQSLTADDLIVLYSPEEQISDAGNRLVIGAGTGLGVAPLFYDGKNYHPVSSEGGHFDFAPISETQQLLLAWLWQQWSHVSYERVLSGPGLEALYHFFKAVDCPVSYSSKNSTQSTQSLGLNKNRLNAAQHNLLATLATAGNSPLSPLGDKALSAAQISAAADLGDPVAIKALTEFVTI
jgi:glucokinase